MIITKANKTYKVIKEYPTYVVCRSVEYGYKTTFHKHELGMIKERIKPPRSDIHPEKVVI